jgi:hypothetical protein
MFLALLKIISDLFIVNFTKNYFFNLAANIFLLLTLCIYPCRIIIFKHSIIFSFIFMHSNARSDIREFAIYLTALLLIIRSKIAFRSASLASWLIRFNEWFIRSTLLDFNSFINVWTKFYGISIAYSPFSIIFDRN